MKLAGIDVRAGQAPNFRRIDIGDVGAAPPPLLGTGARAFRGLLGMRGINRSRAARLGLQAKPFDKVEHEIRCTSGEAPEPLAALEPERGLDLVGIMFEPGNDLAAIAAGGAIARRLGFEDDDVAPGFGEMKRRGKAQITSADHQDVGGGAADERVELRRGDCRVLPKIGEAAHAQ